MPGMNLSQNAQQPSALKKHPIFGKGLIAIIIILILSLIAWQGLAYWERRIDTEISDITARITETQASFGGKQADEVADLQFRLDAIEKSFSGKVYPGEMLRGLEGVILPGIDLSEYSFNKEKGSITIAGEADSFLLVAQQMVLLKKMSDFSAISVDKLKREENGKISFNLLATLNQSI